MVPCLCKGTEIYSFQLDMVSPAQWHLRLQGWPRESDTASAHKRSIRQLAGEGFFLPSAATALYPLLHTIDAPWQQLAQTVTPHRCLLVASHVDREVPVAALARLHCVQSASLG